MLSLVRVRRAAAPSLAVVAVLVAAGCSSPAPAPTQPAAAQSQTASPSPSSTTPDASSPTTPDPAPSTSDATPATPAASASSVTATATATASGTSTTAGSGTSEDPAAFVDRLKAAGADTTTVHVEMDMSGQGQTITMEGDTRLDATNPAMKLDMSVSGIKLQMRVVDKLVYVKGMPGQSPTKWARFDEKSTMGRQIAASADQADPRKMYDQFERGLTKVESIGTQSVDGERMEAYDLTLDSKKALGNAGTASPGMPETVRYRVWLDRNDDMRKVTFEVTGVKATVRMSKYGEPVDITAPPAGQVVKGRT